MQNKNREKIRSRLNELLNQKKVLIAAHRGSSGGNIMENTPRSTVVALRQKADIIEMDVARDLDGNYFIVHDGMEFRLFADGKNITQMTGSETGKLVFYNSNRVECGKPISLDDMLDDLKQRGCLINVDRCWRYWDHVLPVFARHDMADQLLFKSSVERKYLDWFKAYGGDMMYMPIIYSMEEWELVKSYDINLVGAEIIFDTEDHPLANPEFLAQMKADGQFCWGNAITLGGQFNLSAWHDDDNALLQNPDDNWGWLVKQGFNVIQTDWPLLLHEYLSNGPVPERNA